MTNDEPIGWTLEFEIKPGEEAAFRKAADDAISIAKADEPGTRHYEWYLNPKDNTWTLHEQFADQEGALAHATGKVATQVFPKLLASSELRSMRVYGKPDEKLAKALEAMPVTSTASYVDGFHR